MRSTLAVRSLMSGTFAMSLAYCLAVPTSCDAAAQMCHHAGDEGAARAVPGCELRAGVAGEQDGRARRNRNAGSARGQVSGGVRGGVEHAPGGRAFETKLLQASG